MTSDYPIGQTIAEREKTHGPWSSQSETAQQLKAVMRQSRNWPDLSASQAEALEMVAVKISRILNGDPNHLDSWHDLKGYGHLGKSMIPLQG